MKINFNTAVIRIIISGHVTLCYVVACMLCALIMLREHISTQCAMLVCIKYEHLSTRLVFCAENILREWTPTTSGSSRSLNPAFFHSSFAFSHYLTIILSFFLFFFAVKDINRDSQIMAKSSMHWPGEPTSHPRRKVHTYRNCILNQTCEK